MAGSTSARPRPTGWVAWIVFEAGLMLVLGGLNLITGFAAVLQDEIFVSGDEGAFAVDVTTWGWIHMAFGALLVAVGMGLYGGARWATVTAAVLVAANMISQMAVLPAYPYWSILVIGLGAFVLWALLVHGSERISDL